MQLKQYKSLFTLFVLIILGASITLSLYWYSRLPKFPSTGGSVCEGTVGQPHLLNPLYSDLNPVDRELSSLIFRGLIKFNSRNQPEGDLAEKWTIKNDNKAYVIELKKDQFWHDGEKITSDDVIFTYQLTQEENYQGPKSNTFEEVKIERIDDYQLQFVLKEPFSPFLENLAMGILPEHLWQDVPLDKLRTHPLNLQPVGSGLAKFLEIQFSNRIENWIEQIEFKLTDAYLNSIRFKFYPSHTDLITGLKLAEFDTTTLVTQENLNTFKNWPNYTKFMQPIWGRNMVLIFNTRKDKFKAKNVRETLAAAIYNSEPSQDIFSNKVRTYSPIPRTSWGYKLTSKDFQDKEASLPAKTTLKTPHDPNYLTTANFIKETWKNVGVETEIIPLDQTGLTETIQRRSFNVLLITQESGHDPDQYIYWHSTQKESPLLNLSGISHPKIDKSLEDGRQKNNIMERKKAYEDFQNHFHLNVPAIFLYHPNLYYLASTKIKSLNLRNLWTPADRFSNLNNWYIKEKRPLF